MPKRRSLRLLDPLKASTAAVGALVGPAARAAEMLSEGRKLVERLRREGGIRSLPSADEIRPEDEYSRAFGYDRARQLLDPELEPRRLQAAERRAKILEMSLAGRRVREIAAAVQLRPDYVVKIRARLREEGKLPPL